MGLVLAWSAETERTEARALGFQKCGHDVRLIGADEARRLEPRLAHPAELAMFAPGEGAVDPGHAARILIEAARDRGAGLLSGHRVTRILVSDGRINGVRVGEVELLADTVVLAAGTETSALYRHLGLDLPVHASPAIRMRFRVPGPLVSRIVETPAVEVRQISDTLLQAAEDYIDDSAENGPAMIAERTRLAISKDLTGGAGAVLEEVAVGQRPMPDDGGPILGPPPGLPGLYLAVMHSGVTLATTVGRMVAEEPTYPAMDS